MDAALVPHRPAATLGIAGEVTAEQARDRLAELGHDDPERAHGVEDSFVAAVLAAIADGHPDPAGLARAALIVQSAEYDRWYA